MLTPVKSDLTFYSPDLAFRLTQTTKNFNHFSQITLSCCYIFTIRNLTRELTNYYSLELKLQGFPRRLLLHETLGSSREDDPKRLV